MPSVPVLPLAKAHALGNDFLLVGTATMTGLDPASVARQACDRHRGIGADGLMVMREDDAGARTALFNADGGEAEVSGNGVRCAAAWIAWQRQLSVGARVVIGTAAGDKVLDLLEADGPRLTFRADMGAPSELRAEAIDVDGTLVDVVTLRVGNPQCVVLGPATEDCLHSLAARLAVHPRFPRGTNVELASLEGPGRLRILIWERGVGPTEASGTGACASAVAAAFAGGAGRDLQVISPGGTQRVEWTDTTLLLTGWAEVVGTVEWWRPA